MRFVPSTHPAATPLRGRAGRRLAITRRRALWAVLALTLGGCAAADTRGPGGPRGPVRVIVTLNIPEMAADRAPREVDLAARRNAIAKLTARLLKRLAPYEAKLVRGSELLPTIAIILDAGGIERLRTLPEVRAVFLDVPSPPLRR
jgi:hypothetical protein